MLLVSRRRFNRNRSFPEQLDIVHLGLVPGFQRRGCDGRQAVGELPPDSDADYGMRQVAVVEEGVYDCFSIEEVCGFVRKVGLVVAWGESVYILDM